MIDGPWAKPSIYPDISGFLENPTAGIEKLRSLGGGFEAIAGSKPAELVSKITGGDGNLADKAKKALSGLLSNGNDNEQDSGQQGSGQQGGVAGAIGALGSALGQDNEQSAPAAALKPGDAPTPRSKPAAPAGSSTGNAVTNIIQDQLDGSTDQSGTTPATAEQAEKLIKGLGGLLKRN